MARPPIKKISGKTVLAHEGGTVFFHKHLSAKAKARKRKARQARKKSRKS